jgi:hypothetical protein
MSIVRYPPTAQLSADGPILWYVGKAVHFLGPAPRGLRNRHRTGPWNSAAGSSLPIQALRAVMIRVMADGIIGLSQF